MICLTDGVSLPVTVAAELIVEYGWAIVPNAIPGVILGRLTAELAPLQAAAGRGGVRNLLDVAAVRSLVRSAALRELAEVVLGADCVAVKATLFDKTAEANWKVPWHQDLAIAVRGRRDLPGYGPWTRKQGVLHVQPPAEVLEQMLAIRVHLDACGPDCGPVRVLPGSHRAGRLSAASIEAWRESGAEAVCCVERGGLLAFRPLLLHASSSARAPDHRRVIHCEFAGASALPAELQWAFAV
jgi:ectoine hydroxylase-related dioxygenase (phytanoyl-CoA dioxygenase family)